MYIAREDGFVTIYDTFSGAIVNSFDVGDQLGGMDLSADGSFLLVVERTAVSINGNDAVFALHKVDTATGAVTDFTKSFFGIEGPFNDVALFADGTAIVTTTLRGSGNTTTYRFDTETGVFSTLASPSAQGPIVTASADRLTVLLTNGRNVSGPNQMYDLVGEDVLQLVASRGVASSGNSLHAFSADGAFAAYVERQLGVDVFDGRLNKITTIAGINGNDVGALAFDDHGNNLYLLLYGTREIVKVSTADWTIVARIPLPSDLLLWQGLQAFGGDLVVGPDAKYFTLIELEDLYRIDNPTAITPVEGTGAGETMTGTGVQDVLYGLDGDDSLNGAEGDDTLRGGAGNDVLDGGAGHDAMYGGAGDDVYHVDDLRDRAAEPDAAGGSDEVRASVSFALEGNIERLLLQGQGAIDGTGNAIANVIAGNDAANILSGMGGDDLLAGGGGGDTLKGGTGADEMLGGQGDDIYHVDQLGDLLVENFGEGDDTVIASISYALGANFENLTLATGAFSGVGNELANRINGNEGANLLIGGGGADTLAGGTGGDSYIVEDAGDVVQENLGEGRDTVYTLISYALTAGSSVEVLTVYDRSTVNAVNLTGNEFANTIYGNNGINTMTGGLGNDWYFVDGGDTVIEGVSEGALDRVFAGTSFVLTPGAHIEILSTDFHAGTAAINLSGNELGNVIYGNAGNNVLDGKGGIDTLVGFGGDDWYLVDHANDSVVEGASEGTGDRVFASVSYRLAAASYVEILSTDFHAGTAAIDLSGNELGNLIFGNAGNNVLDGRGGIDTLVGFGGDDWYHVDNAADAVAESAGEGTLDRVFAGTSYTLSAGAHIEVFSTDFHAGTAAIDLTGNELDNLIFGNAGSNVLDGKQGNDTLFGFGGVDTFAFTTALGANNVDIIADFDADDVIALDDAVFAGLSLGALSAGAFTTGTVAQDADDRIIYDSGTGRLYYDADGNGAGAQMLFATLSNAPALTAGDITVI